LTVIDHCASGRGLGVGIASVLAPLYISGAGAAAHTPGRLVAFYQLSIVIGILLSYYSNWWLLSFSRLTARLCMGWDLARRVMITESGAPCSAQR
jgi:SP family arabinose:H+ symporter-like MFS transporter